MTNTKYMNKPKLDITKYLPEINMIKDETIRRKTIEVWQKLWAESKYKEISELPVNSSSKYPHIIHNRSVISMAISVAQNVSKFHKVKIDKDILISSAALQDSSKLVETEPDGKGGIRKSKIGEMFQHGFYAAHVAIEVGLPQEIAENILEHTFDNAVYPKTLISKILFYVDQIDMAALNLDRWKKSGFVYR
ncbi:MAG: hypothetical protein QXN16_03485 [Candidatus Micrarchaeaceae archaeon]